MERDNILKEFYDKEEKRLFEELKENGHILEAVLIANPKYKGDLMRISFETKTPILFSECVEDNKLYMAINKEIAKNIKEIIPIMK